MKLIKFLASRIASGALIIAPIYLASLLLLKVAKSVSELVLPLEKIVPEWFPGEHILSLLLVLTACFLIGITSRTNAGYVLFRSLSHRVAGDNQDQTWKPTLAEIEEALVPAFIIEELEDGRFTVFVPSVPTPLPDPSMF